MLVSFSKLRGTISVQDKTFGGRVLSEIDPQQRPRWKVAEDSDFLSSPSASTSVGHCHAVWIDVSVSVVPSFANLFHNFPICLFTSVSLISAEFFNELLKISWTAIKSSLLYQGATVTYLLINSVLTRSLYLLYKYIALTRAKDIETRTTSAVFVKIVLTPQEKII